MCLLAFVTLKKEKKHTYDRLFSNLDYHHYIYLVYDLIKSVKCGLVTILNLIIIIMVSGLILKVISPGWEVECSVKALGDMYL